jgi:hypothetical protein
VLLLDPLKRLLLYGDPRYYKIVQTPKHHWWKETKTMTVTAIKLTDGTDIDTTDAICQGCGSTMADHTCGGGGGTTSVTYNRSGAGSKRKDPATKPPCAHCGAPMHFNYGASAVNGACINMQYAVDTGEVTDPVHQKAGVLTAERWIEVGNWLMGLSDPITYGDMLTAAGGSGTYSGGRAKTGRKKKAVAAAPGSRIEDMAEGEVVESDGETPAPKAKKGRKSRISKITVNGDDLVIEENIADEATNGHDEAVMEEAPITAPVILEESNDEAARAERAARRAARKAEQAAKLAKI